MRNLVLCSLFLSGTLVASGSYAASITVGGGVAVKDPAYRGFSSETRLLPAFFIDHRYFRLAGANLDLKVADHNNVAVVVRARYALYDGYRSKDAWILDGMKRDASIWLGPHISWQFTANSQLFAEVLGDTFSNSEGWQASTGISTRFILTRRLHLEPRVTISWYDKNYIDYYYGVRTAEARDYRIAYQGEAAVLPEAAVRLMYIISPEQAVSLNTGVRFLPDEVYDSPLIDSRTEKNASLFYSYRF
ncbi:MipA/OmpV family protein [Chromatiaceae bacterium AAb-1]|nr:MipA/OmpV family protein [Chromatiaceae bacterium AAb-1]